MDLLSFVPEPDLWSRNWDDDVENEPDALPPMPDPIVSWMPGFKPSSVTTCVVGVKGAGSLLAYSLQQQELAERPQALVGSIDLPECVATGGLFGASPFNPTGLLVALQRGAASDTLVCSCQYDVPADRAAAWARTLFAVLPAGTRFVVVDTLLEAPGLCALASDAAREQCRHLPPARMLTGIGAAVLQRAQAQGRHAIALLTASARREDEHAVVARALADALHRLLPGAALSATGAAILEAAAARLPRSRAHLYM